MMNQKTSVDVSKIKMAIRSGVPLSITTYTLPHDMELYMGSVLADFLKELNQDFMIQYLTYCMQELVTNAKKANAKRIYFEEKGLDITNEQDYWQGMKNFKYDTLNNINYYLQKQKDAGLYVKFMLQYRNNKIKIEVRNNSIITVFEYKRIHDKLCRAQQYTSIEEVLNQVLDDSEGAGLGVVIMILMLKEIGLTEDNFQVLSENGETITRIILPLNTEVKTKINIISKEFEDSIKNLPQFPENITKLDRLLNEPEAKLSDIAIQISNDVALTGELLKLVNSAAFGLSQPCKSIGEAVKLIGLHGIRNMLFSIGTIKAFSSVPGSTEALWNHAYKVAYYSYNLARNFCSYNRNVVEDSYVCGLLHDMGKIIFETIHPAFLERIRIVCKEKGVESELFEKILSGVNHGEIGAKIAEKWNFPYTIVNVIRFHHSPENAPEDTRMLASIVYLADMLVHYQEKKIEFYQIDKAVLSLFRIPSENQIAKISEKLNSSFEEQKMKS